jgi:hypothetical protein
MAYIIDSGFLNNSAGFVYCIFYFHHKYLLVHSEFGFVINHILVCEIPGAWCQRAI